MSELAYHPVPDIGELLDVLVTGKAHQAPGAKGHTPEFFHKACLCLSLCLSDP